MAVVFGTVASGIGVAGLAFQIGEGVVKLKRLCSTIKNARDEVDLLAEDIKLFADLLSEISKSASACHSPAWNRCLEACRIVHQNLNDLTQELDEGFQKGRLRAGINVARRKEKIGALREALERAKSSLNLASLAYLRESSTEEIRNLQHIIEAGFQNLQTLIATPTLTFSSVTRVPIDTTQSSICATSTDPVGKPEPKKNYDVLKEDRHRKHQYQQQRNGIVFKSPTRWIGKMWSIKISQAYSGWDFKFRTYNFVQKLHPGVSGCIRWGDAQGLAELYLTGQASPFDVDADGKTALHEVMDHPEPDTMQLLLNFGADVNFIGRRFSPLVYMLNSLVDFWAINSETIDTSVELLLKSSDINPEESSNLFFAWLPVPAESIRLFSLLRKEVFLDIDKYPMLERIHNVLVFYHHQPSSFWYGLGIQKFDRPFFDIERSWELIGIIGLRLIESYWKENPFSVEDVQGWRSMLLEAVEMNAHLISISHGQSLIDMILAHILPPINNMGGLKQFMITPPAAFLGDIVSILRIWVNELSIAGANLMEYGRLERQLLMRQDSTFEIEVNINAASGRGGVIYYRVINFTFGPTVEDWNIWLSWPLDEWAADFWNLIDNPELFVPGSWVDVDDLEFPDY